MTHLGAAWRALAVLALCALAGFAPGNAQADVYCTATANGLQFSAVDLVADSGPFEVTGTLRYECTNDSIFAVQMQVCFNIGDGYGGPGSLNPRKMGNLLQFQIYQGSTQTIWGSNLNTTIPRPFVWSPNVPAWSLFGGNGRATGSTTMRARLMPGQGTVPPGIYQNGFTDNHTSIAFRASSTTGDCGISRQGSFPFYASATVIKSCIVAANTLDFGVVDGLPASTSISGQSVIGLTCSATTPFKVGLTSQNNSASTSGAGIMKATTAGNTDSLPYQLYRDAARTQVWGNVNDTNTLNGTGTGQPQTLTVHGRIPGANVTPDIYKDIVTVRVTY